MPGSLASLLAPHGLDDLQAAIKDHRRALLRTDSGPDLAKMLPWRIFNGLVSLDEVSHGRQLLILRGRDVPLDMVRAALPPPHHGSVMSSPALQELARQGLTIAINNIQEKIPALDALNATLERWLRVRVHTNAYASFGGGFGFFPHIDNHNVLAVQIHGAKRWRCFGQVEDSPLDIRSFRDEKHLPPPELEVVTQPGDMLFLPRGDVHDAKVVDGVSLHLAVTMVPPVGLDVLSWLKGEARQHRVLRQDLPLLGGPAALAERAEEIRAALHRVVEQFDLNALLETQDHTRNPAQPLNLGLIEHLAADSRIIPSLRRHVALPPDGGTVALGQMTFVLTAEESRLLTSLLSWECATIAEIAQRLPGQDVERHVTALARKGLIYVFPAD